MQDYKEEWQMLSLQWEKDLDLKRLKAEQTVLWLFTSLIQRWKRGGCSREDELQCVFAFINFLKMNA